MLSQVGRSGEAFSAGITLIRLLTRVDFLMFSEAPTPRETPLALTTSVRHGRLAVPLGALRRPPTLPAVSVLRTPSALIAVDPPMPQEV